MQEKFTKFLKPSVVIAGVLLLFSGSAATASCPVGWLGIDKQSSDGKVILTASNRSDIPITFTMALNLRRFNASRNKVFTESLQPSETRQVIMLTRSSANQRGYYRYTTHCTIGNKDADHDDDMVYLMPYERGTSYRVLQSYGSRFSHTGREAYTVDFYMKEGTPVHAARDGVVARIEESHSRGCWNSGCGEDANYIVVLHADDTTGEYYHLQQNGALVEPGQKVIAGQLIGLSGNTGNTTMPHLHFGVYRAISRGREQSIPIRYIAENGVISRPRPGSRYLAVQNRRVSQIKALAPNKKL